VNVLNREAQHLAGLADDLGFHQNRPVAALVIFRSCLQWKTFQADRTVLFDKVLI
jgi:myosin-5